MNCWSGRQRSSALLCLLGVVLALTVGPISIGHGQPLEVGIQVPPLRFPTAVVHVVATDSMMLALTLTHQQGLNRSITRLGLLGLRRLDPVERAGVSITPSLGVGVEVGRLTIHVQGSQSTTPVATLKLVAGGEHRLERPPLTLFARVWHGIGLQPQGLGYGAALGVRFPLRTTR